MFARIIKNDVIGIPVCNHNGNLKYSFINIKFDKINKPYTYKRIKQKGNDCIWDFEITLSRMSPREYFEYIPRIAAAVVYNSTHCDLYEYDRLQSLAKISEDHELEIPIDNLAEYLISEVSILLSIIIRVEYEGGAYEIYEKKDLVEEAPEQPKYLIELVQTDNYLIGYSVVTKDEVIANLALKPIKVKYSPHSFRFYARLEPYSESIAKILLNNVDELNKLAYENNLPEFTKELIVGDDGSYKIVDFENKVIRPFDSSIDTTIRIRPVL